MKLEK